MDKKDETATIKPKVANPPSRPVARTPASRLSTTTTRPATASTATSSAARPAVGSSLSKPPARPTPASTTKRESDTSVDEKPSGDEKSRDGISARPKRMSLAPSSTSRTAAPTPTRRTSMQTAGTSSQATSSSPVAARKVAAPPSTTRTTASTPSATRVRPLASSRTVGTGALADKKRLSTIPASPAVKAGMEEPDDNKENATSAAEEKAAGTARPPLGSRKSTRSLLIEQRIREFELVNSMLRAAMTADGADEEEQQSMDNDAASKIARLKSDLAKVRAFERTHGRVPTAAELEEVQSVIEETPPESVVEADKPPSDGLGAATVPGLQDEASKAQVVALQAELIDLKAKLEQFSKSAEEESVRVLDATEAIRNEHAAKIEQLSLLHETKVSEMERSHQEELRELYQGHETKAEEHALELALARKEIEQSKSELEELRNAAAEQASTRDSNAQLEKEMETKIATLEADYQARLAEGQAKLEEVGLEIANKQKEIVRQREELAKIEGEMSRQNEVIESLKGQVLEFQQAKDEASNAQAALVRALEDQIKALQQEKAEADAAAATSLTAAEEAHTAEIDAIKRQLSDAQEELKTVQGSQESEVQKVLKKAEADLAAVNDELERNRASHSSRIQDLEAQLQKAREEAEAKRADHEKALAALQSQVDAAKTALDEVTANQDKILKEHKTHSESAEKELIALKSAHEKELDTLLSSTQAKHEEEMATLKSGHAEQIQQLEQKLHDSQKEMSALKNTHSSQIKQLEDQMNASLKDLESIEAGHLQQLGRVKSEASESQQKAEKIHIERIRNLELQLNAVEAELTDARAIHGKQLEEMKKQGANEHETTLNALKESHAATVKDLEGQLKSAQGSLDTIKADHAKQLSELEEQISTRHSETITALKAEHAQQIQDVESKAKSLREKALDELRSSLAEEKRQLESQARSLQQELEGNKFQTQMVKSILENTEREAREKEDELNEAVEKLKADMSMSVIKLARMSELQMQHDQLLETQKVLEAQAEKDMEALRAEHAKALAELENTLRAQHEQAIERVREEHSQSVESSQAANQTQYEELRKRMKEEHDNQLDEIMKTLESQWKGQVDQLEEQHAAASARLAEAEKQHEEALRKAKSEHETALAQLQAELQGARDTAESSQSSSVELDDLRTQLVKAQEQAQEIEKRHHEAMVLAREERESALAAMKQELIEAKEAAAQRPDPSQLEELNQKYTIAQKELHELQEKHDHAIREAKAEYDTQLERVLTELNDAKLAAQSTTTPPETEQVVDAIKASLDEAKKTIVSLEAELEGAMLEIETQRNLAESAQKEVERFKAEATTTLPSPKAAGKSVNPLSPKPGLESSRWASSPGAAPEDAAMSSMADNTTPAAADPEESSPVPAATNGKSRNVAGQLAGIQEQIKQLDDLSEDFLEEHQKMAGILSRVDDQTQTMTTDGDKDDDEDLD
ncbi:hypothetical protein AYL99_11165 [Fonsecaea erecta]|uniref:M protein repeat protein n=1 Tax=Fonsecaea erecta TaxID=1367422 RepID=A0A178Z4P5_9EURO|nr:hypothetical protein AYL99_11165 [Fonsecaea erecta]OAP54717.1 hypothetical protein AYL99_11165 [Fonsecaea erecta]